MNRQGLSLSISAKTWARDSHGLFDYESQHVAFNAFETRCSGYLHREENELRFTSTRPPAPATSILSVEGNLEAGQFRLKVANEDPAGSIWMVVREMSENKKSMRLDCGQILKLGRVMYRVKEMREDSSEPMEEVGSETASSDEGEVAGVSETSSEETVCRICYERQQTKDNPLLSPCRCDGTVKYLHLNCLKQWIKSKVTARQTANSVTYQWKTIECDICKLELPLTLKTKTAQVDLFEHDKPNAPYIVLEAYPSDRSTAKSMHVIMMTNGRQSVKLGRGHESDVRINDISVSRTHAMLKFDEGHFEIEDNDSKFGTLLRADDGVTISADSCVTVQVGRSLLKLKAQRASVKLGDRDFRQVPAEEAV